MRILIVCSENSGRIAPFIEEQVTSITNFGIETAYCTITQKGVWGYLKSYGKLKHKIAEFNPDIIHAHYGLSGLLANLQRKIPVITTYHGSDINKERVFIFSKWTIRMSSFNIFVSQRNEDKASSKKPFALIPCGVDIELFSSKNKLECRKYFNFVKIKKYVLFAGAFDNDVKNSNLAIQIVEKLENVELIELKGYTRQEVSLLMNAVDACLMTSFTEGSPQFIKEAMACGCPIASVDVGDVREVIGDTEGCYISSKYDVDELSSYLKKAIDFNDKTYGRIRIEKLQYDLKSIAARIIEIYSKILK